MLRTRLTGAALLTLSLLPGCKCFDGANPFSSNRSSGGYPIGMPAPFPGGAPITAGVDPNCNCQQGGALPPGAVIIPPGGTLPNPNPIPTIPPAGIKETPNKGKEFDTDGKEMGKNNPSGMPTGPMLVVPVGQPKIK